MLLYILTFLLSLLLAIYITPVMREAALRFGIIDKPDGNLKKQDRPVAYLGGLAIYLSLLITLAIVYEFDRNMLGLLLGGTIVVLLGLVDDFGILTPKVKLAGQLVAIWVLIKSGIYIQLEFLPKTFGVPVLAYALTIFWLAGITNAFNIIDVLDGLAATVAAAASLVFFGIAFMNNKPIIAVFTLALAGALFGFLKYNKSPAQIYLGDTGSLLLGLMLGSLAMISSYTKHNDMAYAAAILILGVPIFDTFLVMFLRWRRGKPIMHGSPDHFALRLKKMGFSVMTVMILSGLITLLLGAAAFWMIFMKSEVHAFILCCVMALIGIGAAVWVSRIDMYSDENKSDAVVDEKK